MVTLETSIQTAASGRLAGSGGVVTLLLETLEYDRHVLRATP
jgi:hypothetical protein